MLGDEMERALKLAQTVIADPLDRRAAARFDQYGSELALEIGKRCDPSVAVTLSHDDGAATARTLGDLGGVELLLALLEHGQANGARGAS